MSDQGPWDPGDDAYNGRVSLDDGGEDPSSHTTLSLQQGASRQADGRTEQTLDAYESIGSGALHQMQATPVSGVASIDGAQNPPFVTPTEVGRVHQQRAGAAYGCATCRLSPLF